MNKKGLQHQVVFQVLTPLNFSDMAVDTVLSKERSQNIAAQLNPDTTQSRVQQARVSTRLVTQPRPDSESTAADSCLVSDSKKNKKSKSQETRWARGGFLFFFLSLFSKVQQISLWLALGNRGNELGPEREGLHLRRLILRTSPKDFSCLLYTSPSPRDGLLSRMPSSA